MNPSDEWLLDQLPSNAPDMALQWMKEQGIRITDHDYQHFRNVINRKMKMLEKYGLTRWNYRTMPKTGAKIWERN